MTPPPAKSAFLDSFVAPPLAEPWQVMGSSHHLSIKAGQGICHSAALIPRKTLFDRWWDERF